MPFLKVSSIWYLVSCIRNTKYLPCRQAGKILNTKYCKAKGFTLIELLVVMTIIAILIAVVSASFINAQMKGRDGRRKNDLKSVQSALDLYFETNGKYPDSSSGRIRCNVTGDLHIIEWQDPDPSKTAFICNSITYMQQLPKDPAYQDFSGYYYNNPSDFSYVLSAALENSNDPDIQPGVLICTFQPDRNYCVINP